MKLAKKQKAGWRQRYLGILQANLQLSNVASHLTGSYTLCEPEGSTDSQTEDPKSCPAFFRSGLWIILSSIRFARKLASQMPQGAPASNNPCFLTAT